MRHALTAACLLTLACSSPDSDPQALGAAGGTDAQADSETRPDGGSGGATGGSGGDAADSAPEAAAGGQAGDLDASLACGIGDTRACLGPGACSGAQVCLADRSGFGACDCGDSGGGSGGGGSGGAQDSGAGGASGSGGSPDSGGAGGQGTVDSGPACATNQKLCGGACEPKDAAHGCAGDGCDPCPTVTGGTAVCVGGGCDVECDADRVKTDPLACMTGEELTAAGSSVSWEITIDDCDPPCKMPYYGDGHAFCRLSSSGFVCTECLGTFNGHLNCDGLTTPTNQCETYVGQGVFDCP